MPAGAVEDVVAECGAAHVGGIVIISAGFAELGPDGRAVEASLVKSARRYGMRIVGPNCMGLANTDPSIRMNATFAPVDPIPGNVAFMTQSGALGISLIDESARRGIGISSFVSVGNKADISGNDLLRYWESDDRDGGDRAVPRIVRQPSQVRAHRLARCPDEADRRRQVGPQPGRRSRGNVALGRVGHLRRCRRARVVAAPA